jgi:hypothetical protein
MENQGRESQRNNTRAIKDLLVVLAISIAIFVISPHLDISEKLTNVSHRYDHL